MRLELSVSLRILKGKQMLKYFLVGNALPFFKNPVPNSLVTSMENGLRAMVETGVLPEEYIELHLNKDNTWLIFNPTTGEYE